MRAKVVCQGTDRKWSDSGKTCASDPVSPAAHALATVSALRQATFLPGYPRANSAV